MILVIVLLIPRLDGFSYFPGKYLWAEDGGVFINQAQESGIQSLWTPYNGYLHIYPRLVALLANYFDLIHRPVVLIVGWLLAYLFMFFTLIRCAMLFETRSISLLFLVILVSLQPHYGENLFNIANSQWLLGTALSVLVILSSYKPEKPSALRLPILVVMGLTGPFSIILTPVILIKSVLLKKLKPDFWEAAIVISCASIQTYFLIDSERLETPQQTIAAPWEWISSFTQIASFGANSFTATISALLFWVLIIFILFFNLRKTRPASTEVNVLVILLTAAIFIFVSQYINKSDPAVIVELGGGNRYTWIPYSLIYFGVILASNSMRIIQAIIFSLAIFISIENFHKVPSIDLHFQSFVNLVNYENVIIPIAPQTSNFPGWHIYGLHSGNKSLEDLDQIIISPYEFSAADAESNLSNSILTITSTNNDPKLLLNHKLLCDNASDVVIEVNMSRSSDGATQLFIGSDRNFSEQGSFKRWYPDGTVIAQFAFPNISNGFYIRFDPFEKPGTADIVNVTVHCLP